MPRQKVFISWSLPRSKAVAEALHDWLPIVVPSIETWMSAADFDKGAKWTSWRPATLASFASRLKT